MVKTFEEKTKELTDSEKGIKVHVVEVLKKAKGKKKAKKSYNICSSATYEYALASGEFVELTPVRLRKIIHDIRIKGELLGLCASNNGYFVANSEKEIDDCILSLEQRERSIKEVRTALQEQKNVLYNDTSKAGK